MCKHGGPTATTEILYSKGMEKIPSRPARKKDDKRNKERDKKKKRKKKYKKE